MYEETVMWASAYIVDLLEVAEHDFVLNWIEIYGERIIVLVKLLDMRLLKYLTNIPTQNIQPFEF